MFDGIISWQKILGEWDMIDSNKAKLKTLSVLILSECQKMDLSVAQNSSLLIHTHHWQSTSCSKDQSC